MPHRSMTIEQLEQLAHRQRRLHIFMYTSEAVICGNLLVWAVQLIQRQAWQHDPISEALHQFTPFIAPRLHGIGLLIVCLTHAFFMWHDVPGWRRNCIAAEMGFLFFVEYNLIFSYFVNQLFIPGVYGVPILILFSIFNFVSLFKPKAKLPAQEQTECPRDK